MKSLYKFVLLFLLFLLPLNNVFAQRLSVGPSFSYIFINKDWYDKVSCFDASANVFWDTKKHFFFQSGIVFTKSHIYYKLPIPELPLQYIPNNAFPPKGTFYWHYDANWAYEFIHVPLNVAYRFYKNYTMDLYALSGPVLIYNFKTFTYGQQYLIINDTITDYSLINYHYDYNDNHTNFKWSFNISVGGETALSDHIKTGIQFNRSFMYYFEGLGEGNYSFSIFAKYYFDEIEKTKK